MKATVANRIHRAAISIRELENAEYTFNLMINRKAMNKKVSINVGSDRKMKTVWLNEVCTYVLQSGILKIQ